MIKFRYKRKEPSGGMASTQSSSPATTTAAATATVSTAAHKSVISNCNANNSNCRIETVTQTVTNANANSNALMNGNSCNSSNKYISDNNNSIINNNFKKIMISHGKSENPYYDYDIKKDYVSCVNCVVVSVKLPPDLILCCNCTKSHRHGQILY